MKLNAKTIIICVVVCALFFAAGIFTAGQFNNQHIQRLENENSRLESINREQQAIITESERTIESITSRADRLTELNQQAKDRAEQLSQRIERITEIQQDATYELDTAIAIITEIEGIIEFLEASYQF